MYGFGYPRKPFPRVTLGELYNFSLNSLKDSTNRLYDPARVVSGARQLGWASYLVSAGRVTLAGGTSFSHISTLARLPGTTHGVSRVTYFRNFRF